jgi:hypothetical protein
MICHFDSWLEREFQREKNRFEKGVLRKDRREEFLGFLMMRQEKMKILLKRRRLKRFDVKVKEKKEDVVEEE